MCDTKLAKSETKCPICGTDLAAVDEKALENIDISVLKDKTKAIDDILSLLEEEEKKVMAERKAEAQKGKENVGKQEGEKKPVSEKPLPKTEEKEEKKSEERKEMFVCPLCHAEIPVDVNTCPKCGAIFEEAVAFICPVCHTEVSADASTCPKCGAIFVVEGEEAPAVAGSAVEKPPEEKSAPTLAAPAEKPALTPTPEKIPPIEEKKVEKKVEDLAKELALKVNEAKILLETMRKFGVEEKETKESISRSLSAGKEKDYVRALEIMNTALQNGKNLVMEKIGKMIETLENEIRGYAKLGCDVKKGIGYCERTAFAVETENFENAVKIYTQATDYAKKLKENFEARKKEFDALMHNIEEYRTYGVPGMEELKNRLDAAMSAYGSGKIDDGDRVIAEIKEKLNAALPNYVTSRIAEQAGKLREAKLLGMDVKNKIEYLKEANICIKKKDYAQALVWINKIDRKEA